MNLKGVEVVDLGLEVDHVTEDEDHIQGHDQEKGEDEEDKFCH